MEPFISIQIPTYRQARVVGKAIESCLAQTYPHIEIVISDDNSPDDTTAAISPYLSDPRVRYFRNETNLGRVGNYRQALHQYTTGDWVVNLDGDDYFTNPHFLEECAALIQRHEAGNLVLLLNQNPHVRKACPNARQQGSFHYCLLSGKDFLVRYSRMPTFFHLASLFKRSAALEKDFYRAETLNSDFVSLLQLTDMGNLIVSDLEAGYWNFNANSDTQTLAPATAAKGLAAVHDLIDGLNLPKAIREEARRELVFVSNYYYATSMKAPVLTKLRQLLRYPGARFYYLKGIAKILLGR